MIPDTLIGWFVLALGSVALIIRTKQIAAARNIALDPADVTSSDYPNGDGLNGKPFLSTDPGDGAELIDNRVAGAVNAKVSEATQLLQTVTGGGRAVLLVEDNETNQEVISIQLKMLGYEVALANNGREGLSKWKSDSFDLVLSDCQMPEMDGLEMTRVIREAEASVGGKRTPVIAMTANILSVQKERCLEAGMDDFVTKPISIATLRTVLGKWALGDCSKSPEPENRAHP